MPCRSIFLAACLALALPGLAAAAPTVLEGGVSAELPAGWERRDGKAGTIAVEKVFPIAKGQRKTGAAVIHLTIPVRTGTFDENFATVIRGVPELADKRRPSVTDGETINGHKIRIDRRCCGDRQGASIATTTVGIDATAAGGAQHFLVLLTANLRREPADEAEQAMQAVVRSLRVTPRDRPFGVEPAKGDGGLDGVYSYMDSGLAINAFGGMDYKAEMQIMAFDPGGLYSRRLPATTGGTYRLTGGGLLSKPDGIETAAVTGPFAVIRKKAQPFARTSDGITIGKQDHRRVQPPRAGTPYDGRWSSVWASSGSTIGNSTSVSGNRTLVLGRDGRFSRTGSTSVASSSEMGDSRTGFAGTSRRPGEQGRYRVEGYAITFTGDDGTVETRTLFQPDGDSDGLLVIGGANYLKKKDAK